MPPYIYVRCTSCGVNASWRRSMRVGACPIRVAGAAATIQQRQSWHPTADTQQRGQYLALFLLSARKAQR